MSDTEKLVEVHAGATVTWSFEMGSGSEDDKFVIDFVTGPVVEDAPDWEIYLSDAANEEIWSSSRSYKEVNVNSAKKGGFKLSVVCPKGARYNDTLDVTVSCGNQFKTFSAIAKQSIMILKTKLDQEAAVAHEIFVKEIAKAEKNRKLMNAGKDVDSDEDIYAILSPIGLRGYVFVEGMNVDRIRDVARDVKKAYNFVDGEVVMDDIGHYLEPVSAVKGIVEGDLVELVSGPFKGEIARVQSIDNTKEEITVELVEAMVPIPVTVKGDSVRLMEKEK